MYLRRSVWATRHECDFDCERRDFQYIFIIIWPFSLKSNAAIVLPHTHRKGDAMNGFPFLFRRSQGGPERETDTIDEKHSDFIVQTKELFNCFAFVAETVHCTHALN